MSTAVAPDPAAELLLGKGRRQLLALLFSNPDRSFYLRELARMTGASPGTTQRELRALVTVGLSRSHRRGNQVHFQANRASPAFPSLCSFLELTMGIPDILRAGLAPLADRIQFAGIFGSIAKGSPEPTSDVDVLVVGDVEFSEVSDALDGSKHRVQREVVPMVYTRDEFARRVNENAHFVSSVLNSPLIPLIGELPQHGGRLAPERVAASCAALPRGNRPATRRSRPKPG